MSRIALWTIVTLLLVGGAWSLRQPVAEQPSSDANGVSRANAAPDIERPSGDFVIATVNGEPVYHTDFVLAVKSLPPAAQPIAAKPEGKRVILEELVKLKVLEQEARRRGMDRTPEVAVQLRSALDNMLAAVALDRIVSDAPTDLRAFYDAYRDQFRGTRLRQILIAYDGGLVPPKGGGKAPTLEDATAKAEALARRIRDGEAFGAIAAAESDDLQTASAGGSLGLVRPGSLGAQLDEAVDQLAIEEVSGPIKSAYGVHLFEVIGREVSSFEDVQSSLQQQGDQLRARIVVNDLKERAKVTIENPEFFEPVAP